MHSPPQKQLNYYSPNVKGLISERPQMSGRGNKGIEDESMNVSDSSKQSEAVVSSDVEGEDGDNKNGPKSKSNSKMRINESSLPNMRSKK